MITLNRLVNISKDCADLSPVIIFPNWTLLLLLLLLLSLLLLSLLLLSLSLLLLLLLLLLF